MPKESNMYRRLFDIKNVIQQFFFSIHRRNELCNLIYCRLILSSRMQIFRSSETDFSSIDLWSKSVHGKGWAINLILWMKKNDMLDSVKQNTKFCFLWVDSSFRFNDAGPVMYLIGIQYLSPLLDIPAWALTTCFHMIWKFLKPETRASQCDMISSVVSWHSRTWMFST